MQFGRIFKTLTKNCTEQIRFYSLPLPKPPQKKLGYCVISCKHKNLDHYSNIIYNNLDEVPLASKGWKHSKAKGDHFTINPTSSDLNEENVPFENLGINQNLIKSLNSQEIKEATQFQSQAIPAVLSGSHLLLAAETGCGKTISYLIPIVQNLIGRKSEEMNSPKVLIVVPNRELAYQVGEIAQILSEEVNVKVKILVGGRTKKIMMNPEFTDIDILVATPGALGKLATVGVYKLNQVTQAVFDEADTLIDDSFIDRITGIVRRIPQSQIILVSATLPKKIPDILKPIEGNLKEIVSPKIHKPLINIQQKFIRLTRSDKPSTLLYLAKNNKSPMLIFTNRNGTCNWLAMFLRENGVPCANINGDMNYAIRIEQWNNFIRGEANILSATDVGSRGLNTTQVKHVLNYDFPLYAADYLHRIGRIGRLGSPSDCKATNFISGPEEISLVQQIEYAIRKNEALVNVDGNITNIVQKKIARGSKQNI